MVTRPKAPAGSDSHACRRLLERLLDDPATPAAEALTSFSAEVVEAALKTLLPRGAGLLPLLVRLEGSPEKALRKVAGRVRYRLKSAGVALPERPLSPRSRESVWTLREAWASPVDGTGSRALWLFAEGPYDQWLRLSLVLNDQLGILDAVGGPIAKKRIAGDLEHLRDSSERPWISLPPSYTQGLITEAVAFQKDHPLPKEFLRWQNFLIGPPILRPLILDCLDPEEIRANPTLLDHSGDLLTQPELAGWFFDPGAVQSAALELEEARASRLVLSERQKAEREASILAHTTEECFTEGERIRWRRRLEETAYHLWQTERQREASLALSAALALADHERPLRHQPFCLAVVRRSLEVASEIQAGRLQADAVSRQPRWPTPAGARGV